jgi:hypothetical protein
MREISNSDSSYRLHSLPYQRRQYFEEAKPQKEHFGDYWKLFLPTTKEEINREFLRPVTGQ